MQTRMSSNDCDPAVPTVNDEWTFVKHLGSGSFGEVTLWRKRQQQIAIKKFQLSRTVSPSVACEAKRRWVQEVERLGNINHQNIVKTIIPTAELLEKLRASSELHGIPYDLPYLCMEYCVEGDLRSSLRLPENLSGLKEVEVLDFLRHISSAIRYLHRNKIYHRDIKPENIVIQKSMGQSIYKLSDLGLSKDVSPSNSFCSSSFVGTDEYQAPEVKAKMKYGKAADYFSFGLVIYEVCCGQRLNYMEQLLKNRTKNIKIDSEIPLKTHLSEWFRSFLSHWLSKMLEFRPENRGKIVYAAENGSGEISGECLQILFIVLSNSFVQIHTSWAGRYVHPIYQETKLEDIKIGIQTRNEDINLKPEEQLLLCSSGNEVTSALLTSLCKNCRTMTPIYAVSTRPGNQVNLDIFMPADLKKFLLNVGFPLQNVDKTLWSWIIYHVQTEYEKADQYYQTYQALQTWQSRQGMSFLSASWEIYRGEILKPVLQKSSAITILKGIRLNIFLKLKEELNQMSTDVEILLQQLADFHNNYELPNTLDKQGLYKCYKQLVVEYEHWKSTSICTTAVQNYTIENTNSVREVLSLFIKAYHKFLVSYNHNIRLLLDKSIQFSRYGDIIQQKFEKMMQAKKVFGRHNRYGDQNGLCEVNNLENHMSDDDSE